MKYFRGENKSGSYFEGWYFKCQALEGQSIALIPAIHIGGDGKRNASIQVITENQSWYLEFPASSFDASEALLHIAIGGNRFTEKGLMLDIEQEGLSLHGAVNFGPFLRLKFDIMGPFCWFADMECAHSVISMKHALEGGLSLNGCALDLSGGMGYIEADRGRSFPREYLWTQCVWNDCSLMLSIAEIPLGKFYFTGCICAVVLNGQEHRFATYLGGENSQLVIERCSFATGEVAVEGGAYGTKGPAPSGAGKWKYGAYHSRKPVCQGALSPLAWEGARI